MKNTLQLLSALSSVVGGGDEASARERGAAPKRNPVIGRQNELCVVAGRRVPPGWKTTCMCRN